LGIKAHAKQSVRVSVNTCPSRFTKESRSASSQKIFRRSIPRTMIWCSAPAASILAFRCISVQIAANFICFNQYINTPNIQYLFFTRRDLHDSQFGRDIVRCLRFDRSATNRGQYDTPGSPLIIPSICDPCVAVVVFLLQPKAV